ncbi:quinone-dependent dihydroorotate dehydrogenase [Paraflavitalea sp. CAU 1676]|uniref:quinone-dependent dihydroorotate dehydrogenase n=1 Tax=Paraflavitalea sp. CAU 1676 TaxID=3032598 RepID=UPI0023D9BE02|nr:quinone-dependent dihydroorotate dehydrogenase [Paraflavitalea sp. CAU 1676]MDF2187438.1 quinone-dependent dihydroorotate dehydrogenase [Paraflavitalea sp. CAU 1676]
MYTFIRQVLFLFPTEGVHHFSMNALKLACKVGFVKRIIARRNTPASKKLSHHLFGLQFRNPVGLAAGFDKNALYLNELEALGFGYVEIGTVTPKPQAGNDQPRLFRLPKDKALINRMGFNNEGVKVVAKRLKDWKAKQTLGTSKAASADAGEPRLIIGGNIGKNKVTPNEDAWKDYEICFRELYDWVDYFVVNVSSPNTPGLRELQEKDALRKILSHLQTINQTLAGTQQDPKPLLLKIAPDLTREQIDDVIDLAMEIKLDGLVATNTTIDRTGLQSTEAELAQIGAGGLSGKPLTQKSTGIVQYITQRTNGQVPVIASGGIFTGADAQEKLQAGASLIQVWTGFIYEGPGIVQNICKSLA